jgi:nascent polypeptide-associated complex subunit alpha
MFPGMNPRKMQKMMKQMGIQQQEIDAQEVIIKTKDKQLVFLQPQVSKVNMMGQDTFQIVGEPEEKSLSTEPEITEEDITTVMEQANTSKEKAEKALQGAKGDIAKAILDLQS